MARFQEAIRAHSVLLRRTGVSILLMWLSTWFLLAIVTRFRLLSSPSYLSFFAVTVWSFIGAVFGLLLYQVSIRDGEQADRRFLGVVGIILLLSMAPPIGIWRYAQAIEMGELIVWLILHIVAASALVASLLRSRLVSRYETYPKDEYVN